VRPGLEIDRFITIKENQGRPVLNEERFPSRLELPLSPINVESDPDLDPDLTGKTWIFPFSGKEVNKRRPLIHIFSSGITQIIFLGKHSPRILL
jgi:hypothetical protein